MTLACAMCPNASVVLVASTTGEAVGFCDEHVGVAIDVLRRFDRPAPRRRPAAPAPPAAPNPGEEGAP